MQNPLMKFVSESSLDTNWPSLERKSGSAPTRKTALNAFERRNSSKLQLLTGSPEKKRLLNMNENTSSKNYIQINHTTTNRAT